MPFHPRSFILAECATVLCGLVIVGSGCNKVVTQPVIQPPGMESSAKISIHSQMYGNEYTYQEAEISLDSEERLESLAYLKRIEVKDGKMYATIDPVHYFDCNKLESLHQKRPKGCSSHPETGFFIENTDTKTVMYVMASSSGPFFLNGSYGSPEAKRWRSMELKTLQGLLDGRISRSDLQGFYGKNGYYDAVLRDNPLEGVSANLFYVILKDGVIQKLIEKYRA